MENKGKRIGILSIVLGTLILNASAETPNLQKTADCKPEIEIEYNIADRRSYCRSYYLAGSRQEICESPKISVEIESNTSMVNLTDYAEIRISGFRPAIKKLKGLFEMEASLELLDSELPEKSEIQIMRPGYIDHVASVDLIKSEKIAKRIKVGVCPL